MSIIRTLRLDDIKMPVVIEHRRMAIPQAGRMDELDSRVDMLALAVELHYQGGPLRARTHAGVFNFMALYRQLCFSPVRTLQGPLETVLDETIDLVEKLARNNALDLLEARVTAQRLGLMVGAPELAVQRVYRPLPCLPPGRYRSAGIAAAPLQVRVDHSWSNDAEHSAQRNPRPETVSLAFRAVTPAQSLAEDSLAGLYNYIKTYKEADALQDRLVDGPFEQLAEQILQDVQADVADLGPALLEVAITRGGYARCRPILGAQLWL